MSSKGILAIFGFIVIVIITYFVNDHFKRAKFEEEFAKDMEAVQEQEEVKDSQTAIELDNAGKDTLEIVFGPFHHEFVPQQCISLDGFPTGDSKLEVKTKSGKTITDTSVSLEKDAHYLVNLAREKYYLRYMDFNDEDLGPSVYASLDTTISFKGDEFKGKLKEYKNSDVLISEGITDIRNPSLEFLNMNEVFPDYALKGKCFAKFCREEELRDIAKYGEMRGSEWIDAYVECFNQLVEVNNIYSEAQNSNTYSNSSTSSYTDELIYNSLHDLAHDDGLRHYAEAKTTNTFLSCLEKGEYSVLKDVPEDEMRKAARLWRELKNLKVPGPSPSVGEYEVHFDQLNLVERKAKKDPWDYWVYEEGSYHNGKKEGEWKTFRADGTKESKYNYKDGVKDGDCYDYDAYGGSEKTEYEDGEKK